MELNNFNEVVDLLKNPNENKDNELSLYLYEYFSLHGLIVYSNKKFTLPDKPNHFNYLELYLNKNSKTHEFILKKSLKQSMSIKRRIKTMKNFEHENL